LQRANPDMGDRVLTEMMTYLGHKLAAETDEVKEEVAREREAQFESRRREYDLRLGNGKGLTPAERKRYVLNLLSLNLTHRCQ
jgi:hypothetical protein